MLCSGGRSIRRAGQPAEESEEEAMKYFTPELMEQLDSPNAVTANAADAEWDRRLETYEQRLREIEPELPQHLREYNALLLHDARVQSIARDGNQLIMVL